MKPSIIPKELKGKSLYKFIVENEDLIVHAKKSVIKEADCVSSTSLYIDEKGLMVSKAKAAEIQAISKDANRLKIDVVINTTNYFDSHMDVHIPGLWKKTLSDNNKKGFYLLKLHQQTFEAVIGEGLKGSTQKLSWSDLGFGYTGITEALVFTGEIEKERNPYMFNQYANGYIKQHSVGMRYIKIVTCIDDDEYPVQKENWDKYRPMVVNGDEVDAEGCFWAVLEAKINEGSAVLFASNDLTPTQSVEDVTDYNEESKQNDDGTEVMPPKGAQVQAPEKSFLDYIKQTKFIH
jgi:hypothetical protein